MITRITRHDRQLIDEVSDYMQRTDRKSVV